MKPRTIRAVNLLLHVSALCIVMGSLIVFCKATEPKPEEPIQTPQPTVIRTLLVPDIEIPKPTEEPYMIELVEVPEFSALLYATEPIGRYYITAYSHLETGSKITASGGTVHQGNITTCAADVPKYFKFGDYIEVGGRIYRVEDTGSAVKRRHIDIYIPELKKVKNYNSHYEVIYKVTFPFGKPQD